MDLVIRATVIFFFILLVTRVAGRRELSDLQPFDLILLVVLGDLVQQGITQSDQSVGKSPHDPQGTPLSTRRRRGCPQRAKAPLSCS